MKPAKCLFICLKIRLPYNIDYYHQALSSLCTIQFEHQVSALFRTLRQFEPDFLIFEYGTPDPESLKVLQQTRATFPSLPVIMLTEYHSEDLAVWTFRSGVRDYLRTPVNAKELASRVARLIQLTMAPASDNREKPLPVEPMPAQLCSKSKKDQCKTAPALDYIQTSLHEKITLKEAALRCGISTYAFSHLFHKEHKVSFQEFLLRSRIRKAQALLSSSSLPVTEVAYGVRFGDLSYFIRIFRRYVGMTPTDYRLLEETFGTIPMCLPPVSMDPMQQPSAKMFAAVCRLCEDPSCACWYKLIPTQPKRLSATK